MRGKLENLSPNILGRRITPAGAGKTRQPFVHFPGVQDHPRRCGENFAVLRLTVCISLSPPQVRGKLFAGSTRDFWLRITPAGAGKTDCDTDHFRADRDHPRRCGENFPLRTRNRPETGSPPQVRGKQRCRIQGNGQSRITPADAGKT